MLQNNNLELFENKAREIVSLAIELTKDKDLAGGLSRHPIKAARQQNILALEAILRAIIAFLKME